MEESKGASLDKLLVFVIPFMGLIHFIKGRNKGISLLGFFLNLGICIGIGYFLWWCIPMFVDRLSFLGKYPLCNLRPERAPHFGSFVFVLCYRCTFLILGIILSFFTYFFKKIKCNVFYLAFSILLIIPCLLDGFYQIFSDYISTNMIRAITGGFAGVGIGYFIYFPFGKLKLFF